MSRAAKNKSNLYQYLEPYLATGDQDIIATARKNYIRQYQASWRKAQRKNNYSFTISFTPEEAKEIAEGAKKHKRSRTAYIKAASLSYLSLRYIVPDIQAVAEIRQLLTMCFTQIQMLAEDNILRFSTARSILDEIQELEQRVLSTLQYPKTVEQWIKESIQKNPDAKEMIFQLLKIDEQ